MIKDNCTEFVNKIDEVPLKDTIPNEVVSMSLREDITELKAMRKYLGMTQKELAKKAGVTQIVVSQVENAEKSHKETIEKLAVAMGVKPDFFFDE